MLSILTILTAFFVGMIPSRVLVNPFVLMKVYRKSIELEKGSSRCVSAIDVLRLKDVYEWTIKEYGSCMISSTYVALEKHCCNIHNGL